MALTPSERGRQKLEAKVLKLLDKFESSGVIRTKAVLLVAEQLLISERTIFTIIKTAKENGKYEQAAD